jgi:hypothetical protein
LYVAKLGQERVLIVVAAARHNPPLVVEVADFAEWQRHAVAGGLERTKDPVVGAFGDKPGDDNVSRINVLGVDDSGIREGLRPCFGPLPELVPTVQVKTPRSIGVDQPLRCIADYACEVTAVSVVMCSTERFHVFRSHSVSFREWLKAGEPLGSPVVGCTASTASGGFAGSDFVGG